jgi:hypothetical protein
VNCKKKIEKKNKIKVDLRLFDSNFDDWIIVYFENYNCLMMVVVVQLELDLVRLQPLLIDQDDWLSTIDN